MAKRKTPVLLENCGSLITHKVAGCDTCLSFLFDGGEHGVFDPELGRVDVSPADAEIHNQKLSTALIAGLDANCRTGEGGLFYLNRREGVLCVTTWTGELVSSQVQSLGGQRYRFQRGGREFDGCRTGDDECVFFTRVA